MAKATITITKNGNKVCNNALTTKMFTDKLLKEGIAIKMTLESREDFEKALQDAEIISIGHTDCAEEFGVKSERLNVHLEIGDELHVVEANQANGERLAIGVTELSQMKGLFFRFIKIEVLEPIIIEKGLEELEKINKEIETWEQIELEEISL